MKPIFTFLTALLLAPLAGLNLSADAAAPASPGVQTFSAGQAILDLRQTPWQYIHDTTTNKLEEVRIRNDWKTVPVGRSWDLAGHSELRKGVVWVRTRAFVPADSRGERIAFFCTALGGSGNVYVNGSQVGQRVRYAWVHDVAGPFRIELTDALRYGEEMRTYNRGSVVFIVEVRRQGKWDRVLETPVIRFGQTQSVNADIAGADRLRLMTTDGGDGINCDHAVWAEAKLQ